MTANARTQALVEQVAAIPELGGHVMRVADLALGIAHQLDLSELQVGHLLLTAQLHDLGKLAIPDSILSKPSSLTSHEYAIVQRHPLISYAVAKTSGVGAEVCLAVRHHHERWDGSGYPDQLSGERIPLNSRIIAIADAFDAMTSDRPYRAAMPVQQAVEELEAGAGSQFDPELASVAIRLLMVRPIKGNAGASKQIAFME